MAPKYSYQDLRFLDAKTLIYHCTEIKYRKINKRNLDKKIGIIIKCEAEITKFIKYIKSLEKQGSEILNHATNFKKDYQILHLLISDMFDYTLYPGFATHDNTELKKLVDDTQKKLCDYRSWAEKLIALAHNVDQYDGRVGQFYKEFDKILEDEPEFNTHKIKNDLKEAFDIIFVKTVEEEQRIYKEWRRNIEDFRRTFIDEMKSLKNDNIVGASFYTQLSQRVFLKIIPLIEKNKEFTDSLEFYLKIKDDDGCTGEMIRFQERILLAWINTTHHMKAIKSCIRLSGIQDYSMDFTKFTKEYLKRTNFNSEWRNLCNDIRFLDENFAHWN